MEFKDFNILRVRPSQATWTRRGQARARYAGSGPGDRGWATLHHADPCSRLLLMNEQLLTFHLQIRVASRKALAFRTRRLARLALESTGFEPAGSDPPKPSLARPMRHQTVCPLSCQTT
jgi:hypothetical protein